MLNISSRILLDHIVSILCAVILAANKAPYVETIFTAFMAMLVVLPMTLQMLVIIFQTWAKRVITTETLSSGANTVFFNGVKNSPSGMLYYFWYLIRRIIEFGICLACSLSNRQQMTFFVPLLIFEFLRMYYLISCYPLQTRPMNRIEIVNQGLLITYISIRIWIYYNHLEKLEIDLLLITLLPISYFFSMVKYLLVIAVYRRKGRTIERRRAFRSKSWKSVEEQALIDHAVNATN